MSLIDTFRRLESLNHYIKTRNTGSRFELAEKMEISVTTLQSYINFMRDALNAPIDYDHNHKTYFYSEDGSFDFEFQSKSQILIQKEFYDHLKRFLVEKQLTFSEKPDPAQN